MRGTACVTLVGAGPGDPELLTLAGKRALERAEVVLHDRLSSPALLDLAPPGAELVDVGKEGGRHPVPQEEINRLLLHYAQQGKRVVRLKGGDPFLFGRGAEELEALAAAGIPARVIPGVSAALAAPALAGIPLTHRDHAGSVHILTGHGRENREPAIAYGELVRLGGTLVFLMGVGALERIAGGLLGAGMDPETPAALVENGALPGQRRLDAPLREIAARARAAEISPPAVLVVGAVCALELAVPRGRVLCAGTRRTAAKLDGLLRERGIGAEVFEAVRTIPLPLPADLGARLGEYAWIVLASAIGAERLFEALEAADLDARALYGARIAAVGPATAEALHARGLRADLIPAVHDGAHLAGALLEQVRPGERLLLLRARDGTPELPSRLAAQGADFDDVAAYRTQARDMPCGLCDRLKAGAIDLAAFTSPSSVESAVGAAGEALRSIPALCIGESTAEAARRHGLRVTVSRAATAEAMADEAILILGRTTQ